jgi:hypothetical protein
MKKKILEKLQEIGFNPEPPILETILEALPIKYGYDNCLGVYHKGVGYLVCDCSLTTEEGKAEFVYRKDNESLADTAARLLILLESKNIIKFKE